MERARATERKGEFVRVLRAVEGVIFRAAERVALSPHLFILIFRFCSGEGKRVYRQALLGMRSLNSYHRPIYTLP